MALPKLDIVERDPSNVRDMSDDSHSPTAVNNSWKVLVPISVNIFPSDIISQQFSLPISDMLNRAGDDTFSNRKFSYNQVFDLLNVHQWEFYR